MAFNWRVFLRRLIRGALDVATAVILLLPLVLAALVSRGAARRGVGLGPEPLINNVHHAKALRRQGFEAVTFVSHEYYITSQFDVRWLSWRPFNHYALFLMALFRFEILYVYFNGGPLAWTALRGIEPWLYRLAGVKVVAMPYGGDVQDFGVHDDVVYRAAYLQDYPHVLRHRMPTLHRQVRRWLNGADWVISGCDWVRYTRHWHTLMLAHFSIDTDQWCPAASRPAAPRRTFSASRPLRVLHAPNHRAIKGTAFIENVIARLRAGGVPLELVIVQKLPNDELRKLVQDVDVVVEQLVIGWYGLFALEVMACAKPVLTYISPELERLYVLQGLLQPGELPIERVDHENLESRLRAFATGEVDLRERGEQCRQFVLRHHSLDAVGAVFARINHQLGIPPRRVASQAPGS
ncbi:MAG: hypothetical protein Q7S40_19115 [Opitutaceae bacterium]|nr:hypothetical protein [Opitutaceae bacterium]